MHAPHSWPHPHGRGQDTPNPWEPLWNLLCLLGGIAAFPCAIALLVMLATGGDR
ncbi:hypothetical protein [Nonomuraea sp. LPB2021202275-12-8]|uniref:hypothetical protein n=1 Tax=Nonomuraea sp. LPB2021202275-12-8 TaxID=3120159 RepID=UPI00300C03C9